VTAGLRISVVGLSGSGKSTCAELITRFAADRGLSTIRLPLAQPLYRLQSQVYATAGTTLSAGAQDQVLMEDLAGHLRRINPRALLDDFLARVDQAGAGATGPVLLNDDLRDPHVDAPALRARGFRILRITCAESIRQVRLKERADLSVADGSTRQLDLIPTDAVIDNSGERADYQARVQAVLEGWL
jgi:hypothetical protein